MILAADIPAAPLLDMVYSECLADPEVMKLVMEAVESEMEVLVTVETVEILFKN